MMIASVVAGCVIPIGTTTTARRPITTVQDRRGSHYEKDGHRLEFCDARAVSGVSHAEQLMHDCARWAPMVAIPALALVPTTAAAIFTSAFTNDRNVIAGAWITAAAMLAAFIAIELVDSPGSTEDEAVGIYDDAIRRCPGCSQ